MNSGAETLHYAAMEFKEAGQAISGTLSDASTLAGNLQQSAGVVADASNTLKGVVADHANARATFAKMLEDLNATVTNAKTEANMTADVLSRIEQATKGLGQAQMDAEEYLSGVSKILAETHGTFASSLKSVLGDSYKEFYDRLKTATGLLRQAIEELATAAQPAE
jgi:ABC-type transporter Mla subunit MlaD